MGCVRSDCWLRPMSGNIRLLGPDLPNPLVVASNTSDSILQLKNNAIANWPGTAGGTPLLAFCLRSAERPPRHALSALRHPRRARSPSAAATLARTGEPPAPLLGQVKIIYQGRFLTDEKLLRDCSLTEGETVSMHLIVKAITSAKEPADGSSPEGAAQKCSCVVS